MLRLLKWSILGVLLGALAFTGWFVWFVSQPLPLRQSPLEFNIDPGLGLRQVSRRLADSGLGVSAWQFTLLARAMGKAADIKAGSYEVEAGLSPFVLLEKLTRGDTSQGELALIDGWSLRQVRAALDSNTALRHDSNGLTEKDILQCIGASSGGLEGMLFPDTYLFPKNSSDVELLGRAYRAMQRHLQVEWAARRADVPYRSAYEALIMASIVEKETGVAADRGKVASVFINRLKAGMPLQTDPTVIYGMGERYDGSLRRRDLLKDTAFNTYTRAGLPPTPIAMPGLASLRAALHPEKTAYLYFVARGDGSSEFSPDLDSHNRAVNRYIRHK